MAKSAKNKKGSLGFFRKGAVCALVGATALTGGLLVGCDESKNEIRVTQFYHGTESPNEADLQGKIGDYYYESDIGYMWVLTEDGWKFACDLKGLPGDPGEKGDPGNIGPKGEDGTPGVGLVNVTLEPGFDKAGNAYLDYTFHYSNGTTTTERVYSGRELILGEEMSLQQAVDEVAVGATIQLTGDVKLTEPLIVSREVKIDLNGYMIYNDEQNPIWDDSEEVKNWSLITVREGGNLTIEDSGREEDLETISGGIFAYENDCYAIDVREGGKCTINGGTYVGNISAVYVLEGELVVNDGEFMVQQGFEDGRYTLNCYNENYANQTAKITVNGGKFANFNPTKAGDDGNYVKNGKMVVSYEVDIDDTTITLYGLVEAEEAIDMLSSIPAGMAVGVTLTGNLVLDEQLVINKNITLDLNGFTISNVQDIWDNSEGVKAWSLISVQGAGNLTIKGNGTVRAKENDCFAVDVRDGATCTIEDGNFIGNCSAVYVLEGTAIINNGRYSIQQKDGNGYACLINCYNENYAEGTAEIVIKGGTFVGYNPEGYPLEGNFLDDGLTIESYETNGETVYMVLVENPVLD